MTKRKRAMRRDWGSIACVRPGVWRLRYWAETDRGYRRCSETVRGTRRQAGDRLAELRVAHGHDVPCPTVEACWTRWYLPDRERMVEQGDLASQSLIQYRSTWRKHVRQRWAETPVDQVKPLDVQQWLLGLKRVAAEASKHLLRQILDYATRYGIIDANPLAIRYLLPSKSTIARREDGIWSPDELGDVWHACWDTWFEPAMLLCGFGGCRVGEALGVRSGDVRYELVHGVPVAFVRIERQIDGQARIVEHTKNKWSMRTALLAGRPAQRLAHMAQSTSEGSFLSATSSLRHATQRELRLAFFDCLGAANVTGHLFKNLRKTWQTNMRWVLRLPPWAIEPMMGHVGAGVTGRHYDKPSDRDFADLLATAWQQMPFGDQYPWIRDTPASSWAGWRADE